MEVFRFNILPDEVYTKREMFKISLQNCELCGTELEFNYEPRPESNKIEEEGFCSCCQIHMKKSIHIVQ